MSQDVRFALRGFVRQPGFFGVTCLTLALGVALASTIFSVADNVLYRPLPYPQANRLYQIFGAVRGDNRSRFAAAPGDYLAWRGAGVFSSVGAFASERPAALGAGALPHHVGAAAIDDQLLTALSVQPMLGRSFSVSDCRPGAAATAIISASLWRSDFGADPAIVGKIVGVAGVPTQVIGVLPAGFVFPAPADMSTASPPIELLQPLHLSDSQRSDHNSRAYWVIGRLADGVPLTGAQARLDRVQQSLKPFFTSTGVRPGPFDGVSIVPLLDAVTYPSIRDAVRFLLLAVMGVLVVACVNLANMLLARGGEREREFAVRAALGASQTRLVRLLLAEAAVLSACGAAAGVLLARLSFGVVLSQLPPVFGASTRLPQLDARVAAVASGVSFVVAMAFAIMPSLRLSRSEPGWTIKNAGGSFSSDWGWFRDVLVGVEVALGVVIIGTGALVLRSFANVTQVDTGMNAAHVLTMRVTPPARIERGTLQERTAFFREVVEAAGSVPNVQAAFTNEPLMTRRNFGTSLAFEGVDRMLLYGRGSIVSEVHVSPDYFRVMGIPIIRGTAFAAAPDAAPAAVVADRIGRLAGLDPLGRELVSLRAGDPRRYRVVGVVSDARDRAPDLDPMSSIYLPFDAETTASLVIRADNPIAMIAPVTQAIHAARPGAIVDGVDTLDDLAWKAIAERRFNAFIYGAFSLASLVLVAVGIYGVIAYVVSRRTREIGIRLALGATPRRLRSEVTARTVAVVVMGMAVGSAGLAAVQTSLRHLVFGIAANDPVTLASAGALILGVAALAGYLPARRATHVDPIIALRAE